MFTTTVCSPLIPAYLQPMLAQSAQSALEVLNDKITNNIIFLEQN
jgi:hypothetical protein